MQDGRALKLGILGSLAFKLASPGSGRPCPHTSVPLSPVTHHSLQPSCRRSPGARVTLAPSPEVCQQLHCSGRIQPPACSSRPCAEGKISTTWDCKGTTVISVPCTMLAVHMCSVVTKCGAVTSMEAMCSMAHQTGTLEREQGGGLGRAPPS